MFVPEIALVDLLADPLPGAFVVADLQQAWDCGALVVGSNGDGGGGG